MLEELELDDPHWDEIVVVGAKNADENIEDTYDDETQVSEAEDAQELADVTEFLVEDFSDSPFDIPEPVNILKARQARQPESATDFQTLFPFMEAATKFAARQKVKKILPVFTAKEEDWFKSKPAIEVPPVPLAKPSWFSRLSSKIGDAVEGFGKILDYVVPTGSAVAVAATIGLAASDLTKQEHTVMVAQAPKITVQASTVQMQAPKTVEQVTQRPAAKTLAETQPDAVSLNDLLIKKNQEIVHAAGGTKAKYLHSPAAYAQLNATLTKATGFGAILNHPEVKKAKNIAEMVNLVDQYFGEEMADLIESNAAAMHLSVSDIAALR